MLNQTQFSSLFNISRPALGSYEEGRCSPSIEFLLCVAQYFNVPLEDLITKNLSEVWKENAASAMKQKSYKNLSAIHEVRKAANAIAKSAQTLLQNLDPKG